jgi:hypothetical protein
MPLLIVSYGLQYLDKLALSYGAIMGLRTDLVGIPAWGIYYQVLIVCPVSQRSRV